MPKRSSIRPEKIKAVEDLAGAIERHSVVGILNLYKLPAFAFQKIKRELGEQASIKVTRKSILLRALEKSKKKGLEEFVGLYPGIILTSTNPFKLNKFLQKNKSTASAKPGDIAIRDIEVKAGPTDLPPGPAISTLTKVGIPAKVEGGKIAVQRDKVVLKAGGVVNIDLAAALNLLKMEPMEIGLDLVAVWDNGTLYKKDVLSIDEEKILSDIALASQQAFNLAFNIGYPTKETIELMIIRAVRTAKALEGKPL